MTWPQYFWTNRGTFLVDNLSITFGDGMRLGTGRTKWRIKNVVIVVVTAGFVICNEKPYEHSKEIDIAITEDYSQFHRKNRSQIDTLYSMMRPWIQNPLRKNTLIYINLSLFEHLHLLVCVCVCVYFPLCEHAFITPCIHTLIYANLSLFEH